MVVVVYELKKIVACAGMCQNSLLSLDPWLYDVRLLDVQLSLDKLEGFVD